MIQINYKTRRANKKKENIKFINDKKKKIVDDDNRV